MSSNYTYHRIKDTLEYSRDHFEEAQLLLNLGETNPETLQNLTERWQTVLKQGTDMAAWVENHYRVQTPPVLSALEELAKYADVRRPFRLSVIGQKGVGKSALVNALLGAEFSPSDVTGKALSGTRIRLIALPVAGMENNTNSNPDETGQAAWRVQFLTPRRLWEVGSFLLTVARKTVPTVPVDLSNRSAVISTLKKSLSVTNETEAISSLPLGSASQIQAEAAANTLAKMLAVYQKESHLFTPDYRLALDEPQLDGPILPYITQAENDLYLIVDYVERYLPAHEAGFLAGRPIELEDVLGLDDPRDSFFALEAFRESFAVIMVFRCDRGLGSEVSAILKNLFSRDEAELARFGDVADLNKAIIVANRFDEIVSNVAPGSQTNPLKGVADIRLELAKYTSQSQHIPIYLTSASVADVAQKALTMSTQDHTELKANPQFRPTAAYNGYLDGLSNLLVVVSERSNRTNVALPDYLEPFLSRRAELDNPPPAASYERAQLTLELSGIPRLITRVQEALESGSILRGRVANAEYYYRSTVNETALCYARQMQALQIGLQEFSQAPVSQESRLFDRFQHETRQYLEDLDYKFSQEWFALSQRHIYGATSAEAEGLRDGFLETIRRVVWENRQLIQVSESISTGQMVTDAWRKVFEDINDWLVLEGGRQMRGLVGGLLGDIEVTVGQLQKQLAEYAPGPLNPAFWSNFRTRLERLRERLQIQAEALATGYLTDNRFSVYDENIAQVLHIGDDQRRREEVSYLLQEKVRTWFSPMRQLVAKVAMTELNAFVGAVRYYDLGLGAKGSLLVGLELERPNSAQLAPEFSLIALLNHRYYSDENFRRQYALREPSPAERLTLEVREWLSLLQSPLDGLAELNKAVAMIGTIQLNKTMADAEDSDDLSGSQNQTGESTAQNSTPAANLSQVSNATINTQAGKVATDAPARPPYTRLRVPVESLHPYTGVTRQMWEVTNPDDAANSTRLHFSKIDLGKDNADNDRLIIEALGQPQQQQIITGVHSDFWSRSFPGRILKVRFVTSSTTPGWGFVLDGVGTGER